MVQILKPQGSVNSINFDQQIAMKCRKLRKKILLVSTKIAILIRIWKRTPIIPYLDSLISYVTNCSRDFCSAQKFTHEMDRNSHRFGENSHKMSQCLHKIGHKKKIFLLSYGKQTNWWESQKMYVCEVVLIYFHLIYTKWFTNIIGITMHKMFNRKVFQHITKRRKRKY